MKHFMEQSGRKWPQRSAKLRERCSLCGKRSAEDAGLASTGEVAICTECFRLCDEIVAERLA